MTNDADLQPVVAAEFVALADLLGSATEAQWDTPSLCAGWRVREVIAHMTMATPVSTSRMWCKLAATGSGTGTTATAASTWTGARCSACGCTLSNTS